MGAMADRFLSRQSVKAAYAVKGGIVGRAAPHHAGAGLGRVGGAGGKKQGRSQNQNLFHGVFSVEGVPTMFHRVPPLGAHREHGGSGGEN